MPASEVETETEVVEAESIPADSKPIESAKAEEMPTVEAAPSKSPKESLPATPEPTTPQPEDLWEAVRKILRRGQPVKAAAIVDLLTSRGGISRQVRIAMRSMRCSALGPSRGMCCGGRLG